MNWIDRRGNWLGERGKKNEMARPAKELISRADQQTYTVSDIARLLKVDKRTVMNWCFGRDGLEPVLVEKIDWFRLPGTGYIRIREIALKKITDLM